MEGSTSELRLESTQDLARPTGGMRRRVGKEGRGHKAIKMDRSDGVPDVRSYVSWVWPDCEKMMGQVGGKPGLDLEAGAELDHRRPAKPRKRTHPPNGSWVTVFTFHYLAGTG